MKSEKKEKKEKKSSTRMDYNQFNWRSDCPQRNSPSMPENHGLSNQNR